VAELGFGRRVGWMGAGGSAGRFKGASAGISACVPAVSAARIAGGGVAVAREESGRWGMTGGPGLSAAETGTRASNKHGLGVGR